MSSGSSRADSAVEATRSTEHHRQLPPLGFERGVAGGAYDCQVIRRRRGLRARAAIAFASFRRGSERDAEFLEVVVSQFGQDLGLDFAILEHLRIALQPQLPQPSRDVHPSPRAAIWLRTRTLSERQFGGYQFARGLLVPRTAAPGPDSEGSPRHGNDGSGATIGVPASRHGGIQDEAKQAGWLLCLNPRPWSGPLAQTGDRETGERGVGPGLR